MKFIPSFSWGRPAVALAFVGAAFLPRFSSAHIVLHEPASWIVEGTFGDPQKDGPCGGTGSAVTPTNAVTTYHAGDTVHFRWNETIPHDGHYRVALALNSRDELIDPPTTSDKNNDSLTAEIQAPPQMPVLLDGIYVHEAKDIEWGEEYTLDVTLPDDVTCEKCTIQLLQFMAHHAPGYFYYHCADITILPRESVAEPSDEADATGHIPVADDLEPEPPDVASGESDVSGDGTLKGTGTIADTGSKSGGGKAGGCSTSRDPSASLAALLVILGCLGFRLARRESRADYPNYTAT